MSQISIPDKSIVQAQGTYQTCETTSAQVTIGRIGYWSALLASLCAAGYGIAVIILFASMLSAQTASASQGWTGISDFLAAFSAIQMLPLIPSLLLVPAFTALMVSIHSYAPEEKKIWSLLGLAFTLIYAAMAATNYMIQLLPVWRSIQQAEIDGLAMFVMGNPNSIFWALAYAYIYMNLAMLFAAPVFKGTQQMNRTRWLFLLNGASGVVTLASIFLNSPPFYLLGSLVFWCPVFSAATLSVAGLFHQIARKSYS